MIPSGLLRSLVACVSLFVIGGAAVALSACSSSAKTTSSPVAGSVGPCVADESAPVPANRCSSDPSDTSKPPCNTWIEMKLPGTICGDGSDYKFFVSWSNWNNDLVVSFEPGGACWDYDSCSGANGIRGAANPNGIPDDEMQTYQYLNLLRRTSDNPAQHYNMVFLPYCTGDTHTGNNVMTYTSDGPVDGGTGPGGTASLTFHHAGHANVMAVIDWLKKSFPIVPKMLVTGCSAGGAGAIVNYHFIRSGLGSNVQCGYLLDDSGPIFHSYGPSKQLHTLIRAAWNLDPILDSLTPVAGIDGTALKADFGRMNDFLASEFPRDRLSVVLYQMDLNYSLYSYQRFFPGSTEGEIHGLWREDISALIPTLEAHKNFGYYFPFFRMDNCSHCVSIPPIGDPPAIATDMNAILSTPWAGSEIPEDMIDLKQFTIDLLDDTKPLKSYMQSIQQGEGFTPEVSAQCLQGG